MKRFISIITIFLLLVGCNNSVTKESSNDKIDNPTEDAQVPVEDKEEGVEEDSETDEDENVTIIDQEPLYEVNSKSWSVVPIEDANSKVVLLTIDDAPDKYALEMAQTLKELGVKAIFFVNGHFIDTEEEAEVLKQIYDLGFPIGNHTNSHSNLNDLSREEQFHEIVSLNDRIEEITGERPKFFRAPFGVNTEESRQIVTDENMLLMNWSYGYDWEKEYQSKDAIADIMVNTPYLRDGANLLMHDREWTNDALEDIVKGIQAKGFEIVDPDLIRTPE